MSPVLNHPSGVIALAVAPKFHTQERNISIKLAKNRIESKDGW